MEQIIIQDGTQLKQAVVIFDELLKSGPVDIRYRPFKRSKSLEQLGYYYGCVLPIIKKCMKRDGSDYTIDQIDALLKSMFMCDVIFNPLTKQTEKIIRTKRNSTVAEMSEYLQKVINFCAETWHVDVPPSEHYTTMKEIGVI